MRVSASNAMFLHETAPHVQQDTSKPQITEHASHVLPIAQIAVILKLAIVAFPVLTFRVQSVNNAQPATVSTAIITNVLSVLWDISWIPKNAKSVQLTAIFVKTKLSARVANLAISSPRTRLVRLARITVSIVLLVPHVLPVKMATSSTKIGAIRAPINVLLV